MACFFFAGSLQAITTSGRTLRGCTYAHGCWRINKMPGWKDMLNQPGTHMFISSKVLPWDEYKLFLPRTSCWCSRNWSSFKGQKPIWCCSSTLPARVLLRLQGFRLTQTLAVPKNCWWGCHQMEWWPSGHLWPQQTCHRAPNRTWLTLVDSCLWKDGRAVLLRCVWCSPATKFRSCTSRAYFHDSCRPEHILFWCPCEVMSPAVRAFGPQHLAQNIPVFISLVPDFGSAQVTWSDSRHNTDGGRAWSSDELDRAQPRLVICWCRQIRLAGFVTSLCRHDAAKHIDKEKAQRFQPLSSNASDGIGSSGWVRGG